MHKFWKCKNNYARRCYDGMVKYQMKEQNYPDVKFVVINDLVYNKICTGETLMRAILFYKRYNEICFYNITFLYTQFL